MKPLLITSFLGKTVDIQTVEEALRASNGTASAHCITSAGRLAEIAARGEHHLGVCGIPKKLRPGAQVIYKPAGPSTAAYHYTVITTKVILDRRKSGWFFVECVKDIAYPKSSEWMSVTITDAAAVQAVKSLLASVNRSLDGFDKMRAAATAQHEFDEAIGALAGPNNH